MSLVNVSRSFHCFSLALRLYFRGTSRRILSVFHQEVTIDPAPPQQWTILSLLEWASGYLARRGFDEARLHVELMLAHVLGLKRLDLYLQFDRPLTTEERGAFRGFFERRLKHEPLQYILGTTEFMGLTLDVDRSVLIPRPETELLVERALEILKGEASHRKVLEIGTGSGNIAVALGVLAPGSLIVSMDKSGDALEVAARNVARHHLANVTLVEADVFHDFLPGHTFDIVISNPPYVSWDEYQGLDAEVREYEPPAAVTDQAGGLLVISRIAEIAPVRLRPGGTILMELGHGQSALVHDILTASGLVDVEVIMDFARIPRVVQARRPSKEGAAPA